MDPASLQRDTNIANTRVGAVSQGLAVARAGEGPDSERSWWVLRRVSELRCDGTEAGELQ
jgi:hypothetical protein